MIESSLDILYLVLALGVLIISVLLGIILYYIALVVKDFRNTLKLLHEQIQKISETFASIKAKLESSIDTFSLIGWGVKEIIKILREKRSRKKTKSR